MKAEVKKDRYIKIIKEENDEWLVSIETDKTIFIFNPTKEELEALKIKIDEILIQYKLP